MGLHNRGYMKQEGYTGGSGSLAEGLTIGMPKPSQAVKWLLLINGMMFVLQIFFDRRGMLSRNLGVTVGAWWQVWRYITFQFLHAGWWHIVMNMLGLYILGSPLERHFGTRKFVRFYLSCGVTAGAAYAVIGALYPQFPPTMPIIGASGGVFGIVLGAAVFFPQFRIIFILFPLPIRFAALIIFAGMILTVLQGLTGENPMYAMSDVAHLGGTLAAAVWIWVLPAMQGASAPGAGRSDGAGGRGRMSLQQKLRDGAWERKMQKRREEQAEIDRILQKIHEQGIQKLNAREKRLLKNGTRKQQDDDRELRKL
jgi:membrane associated rhomboid family serine protease